MNNATSYRLVVKEFKLENLKVPPNVRSNLAAVMLYAQKHEWKVIAFYAATYHIILNRKDQQMNIYLTKMSVQTVMVHPRKGKTQLNRKNMDIISLEAIFKNVRKHTGKGYYVKK